MKHKILILLALLLNFCFSTLAVTFTVTNTNTSGAGSLYDAINSANFTPSPPHNIVFNIPIGDGGYNATQGVWIINFTPSSKLPYILGSNINIDGTSQSNFAGNTNINGPEIVLDGGGNTDYCFFIMNAANISIKGFNIRQFTYGIQISGNTAQNCIISGNYIGTNHDGTDTAGCYIGVELLNLSSNNQIGGTNLGERNIISGNEHIGLRILNSSHNTIINNYIGTDRTGTIAVRNYDGLSIEAYSQYNQIGSDNPADRNLISGNIAYGLPLIGADTRFNIIQGNYIGTNINGTSAIPNTYGILFDDGSRYNTVGGYNNGEGNLLSGNSAYGLFIYNNGTTENYIYANLIGTDYSGTVAVANGNGVVIDGIATKHVLDKNIISGNLQHGIVIHITGTNEHLICRNYIGTDISGTLALPNGADGVRIAEGGQYNIIGIAPDSGNIIAWNGGNGINILSITDIGNKISGNSIHSNGMLGIDLFPQGVSENDPGDIDNGPNQGMNFPDIDTVIFNSGTSENIISGHLDTPNPDSCTIEIYRALPDTSGHGEGIEYLCTVIPDASGNWADTISGLNDNDFLTSLATDQNGNSSEFSISRSQYQFAKLEETTINKIHIYPNPCNNILHISGKDIIHIGLFDLQGKLLYSTDFHNPQESIAVSQYKCGIYLLKVQTKSNIYLKKVNILK